MSLIINLPPEVESELRTSMADFDQTAKEAMLVEFYRQERLTHSQLARALGLSRYQTNDVLKRHHVEEDLLTVEEFQQQLRSIGI